MCLFRRKEVQPEAFKRMEKIVVFARFERILGVEFCKPFVDVEMSRIHTAESNIVGMRL